MENPGSLLAKLRWSRATQAQRDAVAQLGKLGGRPRSDSPRCACGVMTQRRAIARAHKCHAASLGPTSSGY